MSLPETPLTRREIYYSVIAGQSDTSALPEIPVTREEEYLDYIARSGGGGTSDYTDLSNKPQINNVELTGNKTSTDLGLVDNVTVTQIKSSGEKIATITVDGIDTDLYASAGGGGGGAVDTVNGKTGDVVLTASDVGALPDNTSIPTKTSDLNNDSNFVADADYVHTDNNYTTAEKTKLSGIEAGAKVNVQPDWSQTDTDADDYIKNKPTIPTVTGKADKVSGAVNGNFAGLDSNGNLTDSGSKASDFAAASHNQASNTITAMTGYEKPQSTSAISTSDSLNGAVGKLEKALDDKAETTNTTVSLPAASWVGAAAPYTQAVNVTGILATDKPILDVVVSSTVATGIDEVAAWACITKAETGAGTITFSCYEDKPTTDITVAVKVVR